jgi:hypothetical protein
MEDTSFLRRFWVWLALDGRWREWILFQLPTLVVIGPCGAVGLTGTWSRHEGITRLLIWARNKM